MTDFSPIAGLAGGVVIGLAALLLLLLTGRIAGISGIVAGAMTPGKDAVPRWLFLAGLIAGAGMYRLLSGVAWPVRDEFSWPVLLTAGLLVGFGTRLGGGCTSGHGVCGVGRMSQRSVVATVTFISVAAVVVFVVRHVLGLSL